MGGYTDAAWLSSARVVRCSVKSGNERNPRPMLLTGQAEDSWGTIPFTGGKVGMTSSQYGSYIRGCTRATMAGTEGGLTARFGKS